MYDLSDADDRNGYVAIAMVVAPHRHELRLGIDNNIKVDAEPPASPATLNN
jgi:hypothetical protein